MLALMPYIIRSSWYSQVGAAAKVFVENGDTQRWQLVVITHYVEAIGDVAVLRLPAQRKAPLAAVAESFSENP